MAGRKPKRKQTRPRAAGGAGSHPGARLRQRADSAGALHKHLLVTALAVFIFAFALRLGYLAQIRDIGFFRHPVSDAFVFVERARGIAAGDWLGPADFVHAPLYAYVLGIVRLFGDEVWAPRIMQSCFGAVACVLLVITARTLVGPRTAILAGLLLACYPPAIFFDGLIQKTSLALLLSTLLLWLLVTVGEQGGWRRSAASGAVLGLLALTRQNALALVPLVLAWIWLKPTGFPLRVRIARLSACGVGLVVTLLPWVIRNRIVIGDFVLTTPNLGQNFAMGNHPEASGTYFEFERGTGRAESEQRAWVRTVERALGRKPTAREVSDYYLRQSLAWIRDNPAAWLTLLAKKWLMVWNAYEAYDTEDYYLYLEHSSMLRLLDRFLHFGVLAPLAAAGLVLTRRDWRRLWLLYGWLLITAFAVAAFVVFGRYRFPLIPVLIVFAAAGVVEGLARIRSGQIGGLVAPAAAAVVAAIAANWTIDHPRVADAVSYTNHAVALREVKRYHEALHELGTALALSPNHVGANLAMCNTLAEVGRYADALPFGERARAAAPNYSAAYRGLGDALLGLNRLDQALAMYERAIECNSDDYRALNMLATAQARQERIEEALANFARVLELAPEYPEGHLNLGNTLLLANRIDDAASAYRRALALRPDFVEALHNLGVVEMDRGNRDRAIELFRRALDVDRNFEPARRSLAEAEAARR